VSIDNLTRFCHGFFMNQVALPQDRPDAILDAAFHAFATYGFRRTAMDDIARGAGMSRSALYLHYRNKEDIFRSLAQRFFEKTLGDMALVLADADGPKDETLIAAFAAKDGAFMEVVLGTPHGAELMDAGFAISGDIVRQAEEQIVGLLADWLCKHPLPDGIGTAPEIAATMMTALHGLKTQARGFAAYRAGQVRLARLFARALHA
jgi:AcrR family transcriptional regulator